VLPGRAYRGVPGAYILTPLRLGDGSAILVNRGWAGAADGATVPPELFDVSGSGRVTGIVDAFPGRGQSLAARAATAAADTFRRVWFAIDEPALRGQFPYPLVDVIVRQTPAADVPERPIRLEPPVLDEGPHLGYAIQWFSFAVIAVVGWIAMLLRRERGCWTADACPRTRPWAPCTCAWPISTVRSSSTASSSTCTSRSVPATAWRSPPRQANRTSSA
jgi:surfeit locus 1 family protein